MGCFICTAQIVELFLGHGLLAMHDDRLRPPLTRRDAAARSATVPVSSRISVTQDQRSASGLGKFQIFAYLRLALQSETTRMSADLGEEQTKVVDEALVF